MNKNTKNVIFQIWNVAFYTFFWGKFSKFWKCACVKKLTNMMSDAWQLISCFTTIHFDLATSLFSISISIKIYYLSRTKKAAKTSFPSAGDNETCDWFKFNVAATGQCAHAAPFWTLLIHSNPGQVVWQTSVQWLSSRLSPAEGLSQLGWFEVVGRQ